MMAVENGRGRINSDISFIYLLYNMPKKKKNTFKYMSDMVKDPIFWQNFSFIVTDDFEYIVDMIKESEYKKLMIEHLEKQWGHGWWWFHLWFWRAWYHVILEGMISWDRWFCCIKKAIINYAVTWNYTFDTEYRWKMFLNKRWFP